MARCREKPPGEDWDGVIVTHSLDSVRNMCDRAAWLEHGHLKEVGLSGHVVESYLTHVRSARDDAKEADEKGLLSADGLRMLVPVALMKLTFGTSVRRECSVRNRITFGTT